MFHRVRSFLDTTLRRTVRPGASADPSMVPALLPRLAPYPGRLLPVALVLLLTAWLVLLPASAQPWDLIPGDPGHTDVGATISYHWLVEQTGLAGGSHSRLLGFPLGPDRTVMNGFPLDVLVSSGFAKLLGWPAGYTMFYLLELWLLGVSTAWLAGRWWRSPLAALVAGVVIQSSGVITIELQQGRTAQTFGLIFLPLALAFFSSALITGRRRDAAITGLALGLSMLTYWYYAWYFGLALGVMIPLALLERRRVIEPTIIAGAVALAVVALPLAYTFGGLVEQTGMDVTPDSTVSRRGLEITVYELVQGLRVGWRDLALGKLTLGPALLALAAAGVARGRLRRVLAPALWVAVGWYASQGVHAHLPLGNGELIAPFALTLQLPLLRRLWWPYRAFLVLMPAVALLAGGGVVWLQRRLGRRGRILWLVPGLLLGEAFLVLPQLPLDATVGGEDEHTAALSARDGPLLVLPSSSGYLRQDAAPLVRQVQHGRPLVNWTMHPYDSNVPTVYRDLASHGQLGFLYECELNPDLDPAEPTWSESAGLAVWGVADVYLDMAVIEAAEDDGDDYRACIERSLGSHVEVAGPYLRYDTALSSSPSEVSVP